MSFLDIKALVGSMKSANALNGIENLEVEKDEPFFNLLDFNKIQAKKTIIGNDFVIPRRYTVIENKPNSTYHELDGFASSSQLKKLNKSEKAFVQSMTDKGNGKSSFSMDFGTAIHDMLEGIANGHGYNDLLSEWSTWHKKTVIDLDEKICPVYVKGILTKICGEISNMGIEPMLRNSYAELSVYNGLDKTKIRPDFLVPKSVYGRHIHIALKSTKSVDSFWNQIKWYGYDVSFGMYNLELQQMLGETVTTVLMIVDKDAGGLIQFAEISKATMERWHKKYNDLLKKKNKVDWSNPKGYKNIFY